MLEFIGESFNPGSVGEVTFGGGDRPERPKPVRIIRLFIAFAMLGGWIWVLASPCGITSLKWWAIASGLTLMYLVIGWHVRPDPDMDNIGWAGGIMDHPFRYSDDINRSLLFLRMLLWPGLFVSESLLDAPRLLQSQPVPRRRSRRRRTRPRPDDSVFHETDRG